MPEVWLRSEKLDNSIFYPGFELPDCIGTGSGPLLIVGTGRCVLEDLDVYGRPPGDVFVLKHMGMFYPRFQHWWVSDTNDWPLWLNYQAGTGRNKAVATPYKVHANTSCEGAEIDYLWQFNPRVARSAGLEASIVAIVMGYDPIVLAGCPADNTGHFFPDQRYRQDVEVLDYGAADHERGWRELNERVFKGRVSSLSGNTKKWLS